MSSGRSAGLVKLTKTCNICKFRHQKCNGSRPQCQTCALRGLKCVYSGIPAHKITGLSCYEGDPNPSPASPFRASVQHFVAVVARTLLDGNGAELALSLAAPSGYAEEIDPAPPSRGLSARALYPLDRSALPPKAQLQSLLDSFLDGPNKMIFICEPLESQYQLNNLYCQNGNISDASLCLILLQLAVGARNSGVIPHQVSSTFYEGGQRAINSAIEKIQSNWLWVVQAHLLDCIYSMSAKPGACWLVLGSAIRIAQTYHIDDANSKNSSFSVAERPKWRQVWLGIMCLDAWLSVALGRLPQISKHISRDPFLQDVYMEVGMPTHSVQTSLARLAVIEGGILRDIYTANSPSIHIYEKYVNELKRWLSALPPNFHTDHRPEKSRSDRSAIHTLQLVYLDSMLLVTRPLLLESTWEPNPLVTQLNTRLDGQTCVDTANQISHLSSLMKSQGLLAKRSWPVIHANFHAALVLLTSVSQKESGACYSLTGIQLQTRRQIEYDALTACMNILAYCATGDQLAKQYLSIAQLFQSALSAADIMFVSETKPGMLSTTSDSIIIDVSPQAYDWSTTTQYWSIDPIFQPFAFNLFDSIHPSTWSPTPYGPNVKIPYGPAFAG